MRYAGNFAQLDEQSTDEVMERSPKGSSRPRPNLSVLVAAVMSAMG